MAITLNFGVASNTNGISNTVVPTVIKTLVQAAGGVTSQRIIATGNFTIAATPGSLVVIVNSPEATADVGIRDPTFASGLFKVIPGDYFLSRAGSNGSIYVVGATGALGVVYVLAP